jgi:DNA (cytosine-5)-methyltransferase 1
MAPSIRRAGADVSALAAQVGKARLCVEMRELKACDYGAPTIRKRLFIIATLRRFADRMARAVARRRVATVSDSGGVHRLVDYRVRRSSSGSARSQRRHCGGSRAGIKRFVREQAVRPFIVGIDNRSNGDRDAWAGTDPLRTITTENRFGVVTPFIAGLAHGDHKERAGARARGLDQPIGTIHAGGNNFAMIAPALINTRNGERVGQAPRVRDIEQPFPTVTAAGSQGAMVAAFLARHYGGHENDGHPVSRPVSTITTQDHHHLVTSHVMKLRGSNVGSRADEPLHTVSAQGQHHAEVRAFLLKYHASQRDGHEVTKPLDTITTTDRYGLVTVRGEEYQIVDIGMRMLSPRELFRAQSFPDHYVIDPIVDGAPLTKTAQVRMCGNSVPPVMSEALVRANVVDQRQERAA